MCAGGVPQSTYDAYVENWERHRADTLRLDGPDSRPRVGLTLILAIAPSEKEALAISRRGVDGLVRRTKAVHTRDHLDPLGGRLRSARSGRSTPSSPTSRRR